jgi:hypothetical protein
MDAVAKFMRTQNGLGAVVPDFDAALEVGKTGLTSG